MKEKSNVMVKSLIGCPIGTMMFGIMYVLIYLICGEEKFSIEIMQLGNIHIFVNQFLMSCILFYILTLVVNIGKNLENDKKEYYKVLIVAILVVLGLIFTRYIVGSTNIKSMFTLIYVLLYIIIGIYMMINDVITQHFINKKLKQISIK